MITKIKHHLFLALCRRIRAGSLRLVMPDGTCHDFKGKLPGPKAELIVHDSRAISMILRHAQMGFCEAFMLEYLSSPDIVSVIALATLQQDVIEKGAGFSWIRKLILKLQHRRNRNNRKGSRRNIAHHYDLGNTFYASWLDPSMTYSSALFNKKSDDLETAQRNKYARVADLANIQSGSRVLEIGCGWGGFAEYITREHGAKVTAITISEQQYDYAKHRIAAAGLSHLVDIQLMDYRDVEGSFDSVVSIEMIEAVGEEYWPSYFNKIATCLNPGGKAVIQMITMNDDSYEYYCSGPDFIQRYIFPGGMLPAMKVLTPIIENARLNLLQADGFGLDYARTLEIWRQRFLDVWPRLSEMGFDQHFKKMWELYLAYCEGGFRTNYIDVKHVVLGAK
jgi:cyclopropane-fatty-acyl-phospholipid synthase